MLACAEGVELVEKGDVSTREGREWDEEVRRRAGVEWERNGETGEVTKRRNAEAWLDSARRSAVLSEQVRAATAATAAVSSSVPEEDVSAAAAAVENRGTQAVKEVLKVSVGLVEEAGEETGVHTVGLGGAITVELPAKRPAPPAEPEAERVVEDTRPRAKVRWTESSPGQ